MHFGKLLGECGIGCGSIGRHGTRCDVRGMGWVNGCEGILLGACKKCCG